MFFFFQAEDGIRDLTVTGVQTCALPILAELELRARPGAPLAARPGSPFARNRLPHEWIVIHGDIDRGPPSPSATPRGLRRDTSAALCPYRSTLPVRPIGDRESLLESLTNAPSPHAGSRLT